MTALNVRVDAETAGLVEKLARATVRTRSDVVRDALQMLRDQPAQSVPAAGKRWPTSLVPGIAACFNYRGAPEIDSRSF